MLNFHNCKVYNNQSSSINEAVIINKEVKVITENNNTYYFFKLVKIENQLYGITKINSTTAKKLDSLIERCSVNGKIAKIKLFENQIKDVYILK